MEILGEHFDFKLFIQELLAQPYFWGVILAITALLFILFKTRRKRRIIRLFDGEDGDISVSRSAVESLVKKTCHDVDRNTLPRVSIKKKRGKLDIKLRIKLFTSQQLENFSTDLQRKLRSVLGEQLGIDNIGSIDILVTEFTTTVPTRDSEE